LWSHRRILRSTGQARAELWTGVVGRRKGLPATGFRGRRGRLARIAPSIGTHCRIGRERSGRIGLATAGVPGIRANWRISPVAVTILKVAISVPGPVVAIVAVSFPPCSISRTASRLVGIALLGDYSSATTSPVIVPSTTAAVTSTASEVATRALGPDRRGREGTVTSTVGKGVFVAIVARRRRARSSTTGVHGAETTRTPRIRIAARSTPVVLFAAPRVRGFSCIAVTTRADAAAATRSVATARRAVLRLGGAGGVPRGAGVWIAGSIGGVGGARGNSGIVLGGTAALEAWRAPIAGRVAGVVALRVARRRHACRPRR
jgi:hypothetical protein